VFVFGGREVPMNEHEQLLQAFMEHLAGLGKAPSTCWAYRTAVSGALRRFSAADGEQVTRHEIALSKSSPRYQRLFRVAWSAFHAFGETSGIAVAPLDPQGGLARIQAPLLDLFEGSGMPVALIAKATWRDIDLVRGVIYDPLRDKREFRLSQSAIVALQHLRAYGFPVGEPGPSDPLIPKGPGRPQPFTSAGLHKAIIAEQTKRGRADVGTRRTARRHYASAPSLPVKMPKFDDPAFPPTEP
jgi:integrase